MILQERDVLMKITGVRPFSWTRRQDRPSTFCSFTQLMISSQACSWYPLVWMLASYNGDKLGILMYSSSVGTMVASHSLSQNANAALAETKRSHNQRLGKVSDEYWTKRCQHLLSTEAALILLSLILQQAWEWWDNSMKYTNWSALWQPPYGNRPLLRVNNLP